MAKVNLEQNLLNEKISLEASLRNSYLGGRWASSENTNYPCIESVQYNLPNRNNSLISILLVLSDDKKSFSYPLLYLKYGDRVGFMGRMPTPKYFAKRGRDFLKDRARNYSEGELRDIGTAVRIAEIVREIVTDVGIGQRIIEEQEQKIQGLQEKEKSLVKLCPERGLGSDDD